MTEDLGLFQLVELSLELNQIVAGVLRYAAFPLWGLYGAHIHGCFNGASSAIITGYVGIEDCHISARAVET